MAEVTKNVAQRANMMRKVMIALEKNQKINIIPVRSRPSTTVTTTRSDSKNTL